MLGYIQDLQASHMDTNKFKEQIKTAAFDRKLLELYPDNILENQRERYIAAIDKFEEYFGPGDANICSAPGRTEISGNHTDHQRGEVLAAAIHLDAIAVVRKTAEARIRIVSEGYSQIEIQIQNPKPDTGTFDKSRGDKAALEIPASTEFGTTKALVQGIIAGFVKRGYAVTGFDAYITSDVPVGSGLSSSASLEILLGKIMATVTGQEVSPIELAQIGQYAENIYFGKPCGLMDQMACAVGNAVHIDFINPEEPIVEQVQLPLEQEGYCLCITDTLGSHADLTPEYAAIVQEMKSVAAFFGKAFLREVEEKDVMNNLSALRENCGDRSVLRALHFYRENERVREERDVLRKGDLPRFLSLVRESGDSSYKYLQNIYAPSNPQEQNLAIALQISETLLKKLAEEQTKETQGVVQSTSGTRTSFAVRVHGGGFAGTIQAFVKNTFCEEYRKQMDEVFGEGSCKVLSIRPYGACVLEETC